MTTDFNRRILKASLDDDYSRERYRSKLRNARHFYRFNESFKLTLTASALGEAEQIARMAYRMTGQQAWRRRKEWVEKCLRAVMASEKEADRD